MTHSPEDFFRRFSLPFRIIVSGPSGVGKTTFTFNLLHDLNDHLPPDKQNYFESVEIFGSVSLPEAEVLKQRLGAKYVNYHKGTSIINYMKAPENSEILIMPNRAPQLWIIEDQSHELVNSQEGLSIFTRLSSHQAISIIATFQNVFTPGRYTRTMKLNATHFFIFRTPADGTIADKLSNQMFGMYHPKFLRSVELQISECNWFYPMILNMTTRFPYPEYIRVYTGILKNQELMFFKATVNREF